MAIVHARVDEKPIHGQVAIMWASAVGATRITVINNEAVKGEMIIAGLKMAKPAGMKLFILFKKRMVEKFAERTYEDDKVFLITKNVGDMAELVEVDPSVPAVNVRNVAKRKGSRPTKKSVNLTEQNIADVKGLTESGIPVTTQTIPNKSDQTILSYLQHRSTIEDYKRADRMKGEASWTILNW